MILFHLPTVPLSLLLFDFNSMCLAFVVLVLVILSGLSSAVFILDWLFCVVYWMFFFPNAHCYVVIFSLYIFINLLSLLMSFFAVYFHAHFLLSPVFPVFFSDLVPCLGSRFVSSI